MCRSSIQAISARCKPCAGAAEDVEPRPGDLDAAIEVEDAEGRPQIPVRLWARSRTFSARRRCAARRCRYRPAVRHGRDRAGWASSQGRLQGLVHLADHAVQRLDPLAHRPHLPDPRPATAASFILPISLETRLRSAFNVSTSVSRLRRSASSARMASTGGSMPARQARRTCSGSLSDQLNIEHGHLPRWNSNAPSSAGRGGARGATCFCRFPEGRPHAAVSGEPGSLTVSLHPCGSDEPSGGPAEWIRPGSLPPRTNRRLSEKGSRAAFSALVCEGSCAPFSCSFDYTVAGEQSRGGGLACYSQMKMSPFDC